MSKSGLKGVPQSSQMGKELKRENKRQDHSGVRADDTTNNENRGEPFTGSARRQVEKASSMGMGKDRICSDHRTDCLIGEGNPTLDHHRNRSDESGDYSKQKGKQGNVLGTEDGFKMNPNSSVR